MSRQNIRELIGLAVRFDKRLGFDNLSIRSFNMENGKAILEEHFNGVEEYIFQNNVTITDTEPVILYLASGFNNEQLKIFMDRLEDFRNNLAALLKKNGSLRITNNSVLYKFRKKTNTL